MTARALNGERISATLILGEPPTSDPSFKELRAADGSRTFLHRHVLRDAKSLTQRHRPNETGALLMGGTFTDGLHPYTVVTDIILPLPGEVIGTSATVEITAEGRRRMEVEGRLRDALASAVGWMHSHPIQQAFFSETDRTEQARWNSPASVGLVVSGLAHADPQWRVFLGSDVVEAHETLGETDHPPAGMEGAANGDAGKLPGAAVTHPTRQIRRVGEIGRSEAPEASPAQLRSSSADDIAPAPAHAAGLRPPALGRDRPWAGSKVFVWLSAALLAAVVVAAVCAVLLDSGSDGPNGLIPTPEQPTGEGVRGSGVPEPQVAPLQGTPTGSPFGPYPGAQP